MPETKIPFADKDFRYQIKGVADMDYYLSAQQQADQYRVAGEQINWTDTNKNFKTSGNLTVYGDIITNSASDTNICIGFETGDKMEVQGGAEYGRYNVFLGYKAGFLNSTGYQNVFLGYQAGYSNTTGRQNVYLGHQVGYSNTTGTRNIAVGKKSLYANTTGYINVAIGSEALENASVPIYDIALGYRALRADGSDGHNVGIGNNTLEILSSGTGHNIAIGGWAGENMTSGYSNILMGYHAGILISTGAYNIAIGYETLAANTTGGLNTVLGYGALKTAVTPSGLVAVGYGAMGLGIVTGADNVAVGKWALYDNTAGFGNVGIGREAAANVTTGDQNIAISSMALLALTTGNQNIAIGYEAGRACLGSGCIFIGHQAGSQETGSNKLYIANSNTATPLIGGVFPNTSLTFTSTDSSFTGKVGIGTASPVGKLHVGTATYAEGAAEATNPALIFINDQNTDGPNFNNTGLEFNIYTAAGTEGYGAKLYTHSTGHRFGIASRYQSLTWTERLVVDIQTGNIFIGDTANTKMTTGLTINQGAADNEILAFKSSDVAHGITDYAETDTYGCIKKIVITTGGLLIRGFGEDVYGIDIYGMVTSDNTAKNTTAIAPVILDCAKKSGTAIVAMGADANLLVVMNLGSTRFIVDEDGDILYDGTAGAYQDHDDIELLAELEVNLDKSKKLKSKDKYNKKDLEDVKLLRPFLSHKRLNMLLMGSIRQLNEKIEALEG